MTNPKKKAKSLPRSKKEAKFKTVRGWAKWDSILSSWHFTTDEMEMGQWEYHNRPHIKTATLKIEL